MTNGLEADLDKQCSCDDDPKRIRVDIGILREAYEIDKRNERNNRPYRPLGFGALNI